MEAPKSNWYVKLENYFVQWGECFSKIPDHLITEPVHALDEMEASSNLLSYQPNNQI